MKVYELNIEHNALIHPKAPFNFDGTVYVPHHFPTPDFEWRNGVCWQTLSFHGRYLGIRMVDKGVLDKPEIRLSIYAKEKLSRERINSVIRELKWRYGFDEDISGFCEKFKSDKFLKTPLKRLKGMRVNCANSLYELLIISITLQNATVGRTAQMMKNILNAYGAKLRFDERELFAYWKPEDIGKVTEGALMALKVGYRAKMIKRVSAEFAKGTINEFDLRKMPTEEAKNELMRLYGVGPATAQIIIGEYLRRYEVLDLKGRVWEQKILSKILFDKELASANKILTLMYDRYGKWQFLGFHYIFTDLFWRHKERKIAWLQKKIRL